MVMNVLKASYYVLALAISQCAMGAPPEHKPVPRILARSDLPLPLGCFRLSPFCHAEGCVRFMQQRNLRAPGYATAEDYCHSTPIEHVLYADGALLQYGEVTYPFEDRQ